jgi:putative transposase
MSIFSLTIGLVVRRGERTWRLERELEGGTLVFADQINGQPMTTTISQLWNDLNAKRLSIVSADSPNANLSPKGELIFDWASLPEDRRAEVERRLKYVRAIQREGLSRGMRRHIQRRLDKVAKSLNDPTPPSGSSVMRWMRRMDLAHGSPAGLLTGDACRRRNPRKLSTVIELARKLLASFYCTQSRPTLKQTAVHLQRALDTKVVQDELTAAEAQLSLSTLRRLKNEIEPYSLDVARYGAGYARNRWRYSLSGSGTTRAMQRYEIDHTTIDLVAVCDRTERSPN